MRTSIALALLAFCSATFAQDDAVVVTALRNPVKKSYSKMLEGAAHFKERQHLAPNAELRFNCAPSGTLSKSRMR